SPVQAHRDAGKHVNHYIFLHIAAVFDDNLPPVSANDRSGTDIHVFSNRHISDDDRGGMYESRFVNHRNPTFEFVYHFEIEFYKTIPQNKQSGRRLVPKILLLKIKPVGCTPQLLAQY